MTGITTVSPSAIVCGRKTNLYFALASNVTLTTSSTLAAVFSTSTIASAAAESISISPPETAWEVINFMGNDSSSFQNKVLEEKPVGTASLTATLVLYTEDDFLEPFLDTTGVTAASTYTRYQIGNEQSPEVSILASIYNGTKTCNVCLDDARITKWGEVRIGAVDGRWEQDIAAICLDSDFWWEYQTS